MTTIGVPWTDAWARRVFPFLFPCSLFNVEGGHRAIVYNRFVSVKDKVYAEGTHFIIPWVERPYVYDVRARAHQVNSQSGSRDLQMVNISIRVLTRPDANKLPDVYRTLGMDFNDLSASERHSRDC